MTSPLISIIIPAYNPGKYIIFAIESVINQTYKNFEIIIIDDGSTEPFINIVKERFSEEKRIIYYYKSNGGLSSARNYGLTKSNGDYIAFIDSDDMWLANKLEIQLHFIKQYNFIYCKYNIIDSENNIHESLNSKIVYKKSHSLKQDLLLGNIIYGSGSAVLISKELVNKVGLFDENLRFGEDWDYWLRCAYADAKFYFITEVLVLIRHHANSMQLNSLNDFKYDNEKLILKKLNKIKIKEKLIYELIFIKACFYHVSLDRFVKSIIDYLPFINFSFFDLFNVIKNSFKYFYFKFKKFIKKNLFSNACYSN